MSHKKIRWMSQSFWPAIRMLGMVLLMLGTASNAFAVGVRPVTVMTYNLYSGASFLPLSTAPSLADIPPRVAAIWANVQASRFPERAEAIANKIQQSGPDLIALQEAYLYRTQSPSDAFTSHPTPATAVAYDYVQLLLNALSRRGLHYAVVSARWRQ